MIRCAPAGAGGDVDFWDDVAEARVLAAEPRNPVGNLDEIGDLMRDTVLLRLQYAVSEAALDKVASLVDAALNVAQGAILCAFAELGDGEAIERSRAATKRVFDKTLSEYDAVCTAYKRRSWIRTTFNPVVCVSIAV